LPLRIAVPGGVVMFKWTCLGVAVVALAAFGWMLNDLRLQVQAVAARADRLASRADELVEKTDNRLPPLLSQAEQIAAQLNRHLPRILAQTEKATAAVNAQLPPLLAESETTVERLADLADGLRQYRALMGVVHGAGQNKDLLSYGASILGLVGGQNATIGVKKPGTAGPLKHPMPAKQWAAAAQPELPFLSLIAKTKGEVLHGLAHTRSLAGPLQIQLADAAPRLLADWIQEMHPESKDVK
jgi:hypothetical protein